MRKNSLNRKFRRMLAASLGAVSFVSTSCVVNAVDERLKKQREVARYFADIANLTKLNSGRGLMNVQPFKGAEDAAGDITAHNYVIGGEMFGLDNTKILLKTLSRDYELPMTLNGVEIGTARLKRRAAGNPLAVRTWRLCPPIATSIPDPATLPGHAANTAKINEWVQERWKEEFNKVDAEIKKQEKAEADAKAAADAEEAEKARARETLLAASNQSMPVYSSQDMSAMSATVLMGTTLPLALSQIQTSQPIAPVPNETEINNPTLNSTSNNQVGFNSQNSDLNLDNK